MISNISAATKSEKSERQSMTRANPSHAFSPGTAGNRTPGTPATLLLIDDDRGVLESLRRVFAGEGWRVLATASGAEALSLLSREQVDLVITDLRMSPVSGWDLLYHERFEHPTLPFFVITALPPRSSGGSDTFAQRFFQKPLDLAALIAAVHAQLGTTRPEPTSISPL
jgi:two-component system, NtrC family, response regulator GlrR